MSQEIHRLSLELILLPGRAALSAFALKKMLGRLQAIDTGVTDCYAEFVHQPRACLRAEASRLPRYYPDRALSHPGPAKPVTFFRSVAWALLLA